MRGNVDSLSYVCWMREDEDDMGDCGGVESDAVGNISEVITICSFFNFDAYEQLNFWINKLQLTRIRPSLVNGTRIFQLTSFRHFI
ncbi:hypothetical protein HanPI659440_Chr06g0230671 [Helianthus annuus]|nr:hypothetical protein HanPI659440_Chr06g0230671 [Helianthus annuus]